jgi:ethanolamine ammonia-lyase small subunit
VSEQIQNNIAFNSIKSLRAHTPARVASDTIGVSLKTNEVIRFRQDFASTKDALAHSLDVTFIQEQLDKSALDYFLLKSRVENREQYLLRPDLGRILNEESESKLTSVSLLSNVDVCICVSDGLSADAVNHQFSDVLNYLMPKLKSAKITVGPICLIENGRVAISDQIGMLLKATLSIIFLGERPGLSSPESMGIYLTYDPKLSNTDANRNCISNIWKKGLQPQEAAEILFYLISSALKQQISGVALKDNSQPHTQLNGE